MYRESPSLKPFTDFLLSFLCFRLGYAILVPSTHVSTVILGTFLLLHFVVVPRINCWEHLPCSYQLINHHVSALQ